MFHATTNIKHSIRVSTIMHTISEVKLLLFFNSWTVIHKSSASTFLWPIIPLNHQIQKIEDAGTSSTFFAGEVVPCEKMQCVEESSKRSHKTTLHKSLQKRVYMISADFHQPCTENVNIGCVQDRLGRVIFYHVIPEVQWNGFYLTRWATLLRVKQISALPDLLKAKQKYYFNLNVED